MKTKKYRLSSVLFLSTVLLLTGCNNEKTDAAEEEVTIREIPIETAEVTFGSLVDEQLLTGKIEAQNEAMILPNTAGEITKIYVKKGDVVRTGQVLAQLDNTNEQNAVDQAEISLKQAELNLKQAEISLEDAKQSQEDSLNTLELQLEQAQMAWVTAKTDLERNQKLYDAGLISLKEYEGYVLQEQNAKIQVDQLNLSKEQVENSLGVQSVETSVELTKQTVVTAAQLALDQAKERLDDKVIKSTISGEIIELNAEVGEMASGQSPFATIIATNTVKVSVNILQDQLNEFKVGDVVDVEVLGFDDSFEGTITYISAVSSGSGLFGIEAEINNSEQLLKPGMVASIKTEEVLEQDKILVPTKSIIQKEGKSVVFIVVDNKAVAKEIEVIRYNTDSTAVAGDLKENDLVVTSGQNLLNDGDLVKIMEEE